MRKLLLLLSCMLAMSSCTTIKENVQRYPDTPYERDIGYLYAFLEDNHPDFFNHISKDEAEAVLRRNLEKQVEDPGSFYYSLAGIAAIAHDSHTQVGMDASIISALDILPIGFDLFGDDLHIVMAADGYENLLGEKVVSINGYSFERIKDLARDTISNDNDVYLAKSLCDNHLRIIQFYLNLSIAEEKAVTITTGDGKETEVPALPYIQASGMEYEYLQKAIPPTLNPASAYSAMLLDDPSALLINYHSCTEMEGFPFSSFADQVVSILSEDPYDTVVIDLRYNGGGNSEIIKPLVKGLKELENQKEIKTYVLIGEDTFSSAVMNAEDLKRELDATFVGRPTGGSSTHYGEIGIGTLPETGVMFQYSTKYFQGSSEGPLVPDIPVQRNLHDYENGTDTDLRALGLVHD